MHAGWSGKKKKKEAAAASVRVTNQVRRKGWSKLLKTLTIKLSLVTDSMAGPGNCPLINIPCHNIYDEFSCLVEYY